MDISITLIAFSLLGAFAGAVVVALFLRGKGTSANLESSLASLEKEWERTGRSIKDETAILRQEMATQAKQGRDESRDTLKTFEDTLINHVERLRQSNEQKLERMRDTVESRLKSIQDDNNLKLEKMRATVDEKLNETLERRLGESFKLVRDQLDKVYKGLGEMQSLASGVDDLKKVLSNVKSRGTWGEVQLGALLEEILTSDQFDRNVATKPDSSEVVEYAIRLPGGGSGSDGPVWLPIDAKFPLEDFQRLMDAQEAADQAAADSAGKSMEARIKLEAKKIQEKYINPPNTTDFALMFLPTEGLYAEVIRRPGLIDFLQREARIVVAGPMTLAALLNSLQMGFRTLAIQERASEVWRTLGIVKTEFGRFGDAIAKTKKKLEEATSNIEGVERRTRVMQKKLTDVQELPAPEEDSSPLT